MDDLTRLWVHHIQIDATDKPKVERTGKSARHTEFPGPGDEAGDHCIV